MKIRLTQAHEFRDFYKNRKPEDTQNGALAKPLVFARGEMS